ncbi:hypothetical protein, partial [Lacticaseibacillus rhamnosus]|uniref:hypothetical protein n=2 Tax=Bacillati TaxID=1783272 RepID=UPI001CDCE82B
MTYYKAIRPDGTSWYDLGFRWVAERGPVEGVEVWHPSPSGEPRYDPARHLAASTEPADCSGMG